MQMPGSLGGRGTFRRTLQASEVKNRGNENVNLARKEQDMHRTVIGLKTPSSVPSTSIIRAPLKLTSVFSIE